jgi:hypothetical protein
LFAGPIRSCSYPKSLGRPEKEREREHIVLANLPANPFVPLSLSSSSYPHFISVLRLVSRSDSQAESRDKRSKLKISHYIALFRRPTLLSFSISSNVSKDATRFDCGSIRLILPIWTVNSLLKCESRSNSFILKSSLSLFLLL